MANYPPKSPRQPAKQTVTIQTGSPQIVAHVEGLAPPKILPEDNGPSSHAHPGPPAAPSQVVQEIEKESKRVQELATQISKRILLFEKWLNQLPGRVEATYWKGGFVEDRDNLEPQSFGLVLKRSGKTWAIYWAWQYDEDDSEPDWKLLSDADLDTKMHAIKYFPMLLTAIKVAQENKKTTLLAGMETFDKFAESVGLKIEGEGN